MGIFQAAKYEGLVTDLRVSFHCRDAWEGLENEVSSFQSYLPSLRENQNTVQIEAAVCPAACHSQSTSCMLFLSLLAASC